MTDTEIRAAIAAERAELAAVLAGLPAAAWDSETLCAGWRVREVVAHMTMPFRSSVPRFVLDMVKAGGNFNRMSDRSARRDATNLSAAELTATLGDNAGHPWKPPGGGYAGALSHDVIHGLDITVPLGIGRKVPEDRLRLVLDGMNAKTMGYFGVDLTDIQLRADDLDWSRGSGTPLSGQAQDLLLVVCGRMLPPGHLHGEPAERFTTT